MAALEVTPAAVVSAAAAVRCFSLDLEPVGLGDGSLVQAIAEEFSTRWGSALRALSDDADACAVALRAAAADYVELDHILVPR